MTPLRLAFLGSPLFAVPALDALHAAGHAIRAVYTQPPRPAGRGHRLAPCPVHARAAALGLPVRHPARLRRDEAEWARFADLDLDVAVVAAYGLILPSAMLDAPRLGCLNIHASLLPRWRGAAPIHAAILAGDRETGITIMQMDEGLDTGPTLLREAIPLGRRDTTPIVHDVLAGLGARLVLRTLAERPHATPQPETGASYAPKLGRDDGRIDWSLDADTIDRQVRAMTPWPGTFTTLGDTRLKILAAHPVGEGTTGGGATGGTPGTVLDGMLSVACGTGAGGPRALRLETVQIPGRPPTDAASFGRGHRIGPGTVLGLST